MHSSVRAPVFSRQLCPWFQETAMDQTSLLSHCVKLLRSKSSRPSVSRARKVVSPVAPADVLEERVLLTADFGDAPAPYPVTLAENGARHSGTGPRLGLTVDVEANGTHSINATADGADEDGIVFGQVRAGRSDNTVVVKVRNAAFGTRLDAWIDFNGDGDWNDPGEKIFNSRQVFNNSDQTLTFTVPADAVLGATFARFRISSAGGLSPTGEALDGEVEDHKVTIGLATPAITKPAASSLVNVTGNYRVNFQWTASAQADSYEIWVRSHNYEAQSEFHRTVVTGTSYTPDVDFGIGKYTVWVRANGANNTTSAWTAARPFTVVAKTTIDPMVKLQTTSRPTITWAPVLGAESYKVWVSNLSTSESPIILQGGLTETSFTPPSSLPLNLYRVWVSSVSANTTAGWSAPVDFITGPAPVPQPMLPTFGREAYSWTAVPGAAAYEFQLKNLRTNEVTLTGTVPGTTWTPGTVLLSGNKYRWWVRAKSAEGVYSQWSVPTDFFAGGQTDVLTPTGTISNTKPVFTWKAVEGAVRYELVVSRLDTGVNVLNKKDILTNSFTATTALAAGTYRVWVRAVSSTNNLSTWSLPITFTIASADAPAAEITEVPQLLASLVEYPLPQHHEQPAQPTLMTDQVLPESGEQISAADRRHNPQTKESSVLTQSGDPPLAQAPLAELVDLAINAWVHGSADIV